jgi:hypothetical protein
MPTHDWTRVDAGLFHDFHLSWIVSLGDALNSGGLPADYFALIEQRHPGPLPDVLTLKLFDTGVAPSNDTTGRVVATAPPRGMRLQQSEAAAYAARTDRLVIRHRHGEVVAIIEIVSPGNKSGRLEFREFVEKALAFLRHGIHLLIVDLFPPGRRDPEGIHKAIWEEIEAESARPPHKPLTLAAYDAGPPQLAYVEFVGVGEPLPEVPLFLKPGVYVPAPLEATYQEAWAAFPKALKGLLQERSVGR